MPQTSGFRSAKQILVVSFATQARAFILSDRSIFYTPRGGRTTAGSNAPGAFLVFPRLLAPDLRLSLGQTNIRLIFHYRAWVPILSDRNIFYALRGGRIMAGYNAPGTFLVLFCSVT